VFCLKGCGDHGCVCSTVEKLRQQIPDVEKNLEKSKNELTSIVAEESKASNEVVMQRQFVTSFTWQNDTCIACTQYYLVSCTSAVVIVTVAKKDTVRTTAVNYGM